MIGRISKVRKRDGRLVAVLDVDELQRHRVRRMEVFLESQKVLLKDFEPFAPGLPGKRDARTVGL